MFVCFLSLPWSLTGLPISRVIGCRKTLQQPLQPFDPDAILCVKTSFSAGEVGPGVLLFGEIEKDLANWRQARGQEG